MDANALTALNNVSNDAITEDTAGLILTALIGDANIPSKSSKDSADPVVHIELLKERLHTYIDLGVPVTTAIELTLRDAIASIETADKHDITGEVGALPAPEQTHDNTI